jgi:hypothetical protein
MIRSNQMQYRMQQLLISSMLLLGGCNLGKKTTDLTLQTKPTTVVAGSEVIFTAFIVQKKGQFEGANWSVSCTAGCGTMSNPTNNGSPSDLDTATITYTAPSTPPNPNSITITSTSVENPNSSDSATFTITATLAGKR